MTEFTRSRTRVLLVDDEPPLRQLIARMLEGHGFDVQEAPNALAALDILHQTSDFALMITDIAMPRMNGFDLTERVTRMWPGTRVLLISGQADSVAPIRIGLQETEHAILLKPFTPTDLIHAIDGVLTSPRHGDSAPGSSTPDRAPSR